MLMTQKNVNKDSATKTGTSTRTLQNNRLNYIIPHLQKILASDWLFSSVFFFNTRAILGLHVTSELPCWYLITIEL